jgi:DNA photolyase
MVRRATIRKRSFVCRPAKRVRSGKKGKAGREKSQESAQGNALVWLRQDLRLHDNPVIAAATDHAKASGGTVAFVYVHSPEEDGDSLLLQPGPTIHAILPRPALLIDNTVSPSALSPRCGLQGLRGGQVVHRCCGCITPWSR